MFFDHLGSGELVGDESHVLTSGDTRLDLGSLVFLDSLGSAGVSVGVGTIASSLSDVLALVLLSWDKVDFFDIKFVVLEIGREID